MTFLLYLKPSPSSLECPQNPPERATRPSNSKLADPTLPPANSSNSGHFQRPRDLLILSTFLILLCASFRQGLALSLAPDRQSRGRSKQAIANGISGEQYKEYQSTPTPSISPPCSPRPPSRRGKASSFLHPPASTEQVVPFHRRHSTRVLAGRAASFRPICCRPLDLDPALRIKSFNRIGTG